MLIPDMGGTIGLRLRTVATGVVISGILFEEVGSKMRVIFDDLRWL